MLTLIRIEGCGKLSESVRSFLHPYQYRYKDISKHYGPTRTGHCSSGFCECFCVESSVPEEKLTQLEELAYEDEAIVDWFANNDLEDKVNAG